MTTDPTDVLDADAPHNDVGLLDTFTDKLLDTLYELSLMPYSLTRKPAAYEKYPQELLTRIEIKRLDREEGLRQAFDEWRSSILRKPTYSQTRQDAVFKIGELRGWVMQHSELMLNRRNIRHLRKSMFGRTYTYLYPRLSLIMDYRAYCHNKGLLDETVPIHNAEGHKHPLMRAVADEAFIAEHFPQGTGGTQRQIADALGEERIPELLQQAQEFLVQNAFYFQSVFKNLHRDEQSADSSDHDNDNTASGIEEDER